MITRRNLLLGTATLAMGSVLSSCRSQVANALNVTLLEGAVPPEVLQKFRKQAVEPVNFQSVAQMRTIYQQLQRWQKPVETGGLSWGKLWPWAQAVDEVKPDGLVSLGDYWLTSAIAQDLLDPLEIPTETLNKIPFAWEQFVRRDPSGQPFRPKPKESPEEAGSGENEPQPAPKDNSKLWAAPYKVQSLVIVYRQSQFPQATAESAPFQTWRDLLQPELQGKISLPNHPRIVLGLVQKIQSGRFNPTFEIDDDGNIKLPDASLAEQLREPFDLLNRQVRTYDSSNPLKALVNEDLLASVAWSGDVVTALDRYRDLKVVVPEEGSLLSADMWVRPKGAELSELAQQWIDFCWQTGPATQISVAGKGLSPVFLGEQEMPPALANSLLAGLTMADSELLFPLPAPLQTAYVELWSKLRAG